MKLNEIEYQSVEKNLALFEAKSVGYHCDIKVEAQLLLDNNWDELAHLYHSTDCHVIKRVVMLGISQSARQPFTPYYL